MITVRVHGEDAAFVIAEYRLVAAAESIVLLVAKHPYGINEAREGTLRFQIWPDGTVEMFIEEMLDSAEFENAHTRERDAQAVEKLLELRQKRAWWRRWTDPRQRRAR